MPSRAPVSTLTAAAPAPAATAAASATTGPRPAPAAAASAASRSHQTQHRPAVSWRPAPAGGDRQLSADRRAQEHRVTPAQVTATYLAQISIPAVVGAVAGTILG